MNDYTLTLEKALTDAFILAVQQQIQSALVVTDVESFGIVKLPACFIKCTRQQESIINSAIFQFLVDISLVVQGDDTDALAYENLWANVLAVAYDINGLKASLNSIRPRYAFVFGILRNAGVTMTANDRHRERSVSLTVHAALYAS
jgi:hypothetical protein